MLEDFAVEGADFVGVVTGQRHGRGWREMDVGGWLGAAVVAVRAGGRAGSGGEEGLARGGDGGRVCSEVTPTMCSQQQQQRAAEAAAA